MREAAQARAHPARLLWTLNADTRDQHQAAKPDLAANIDVSDSSSDRVHQAIVTEQAPCLITS
eukprot:XP_001704773.1 Hypothetical protein GL50803_8720 [Giardia lamblia ATCC 50803]